MSYGFDMGFTAVGSELEAYQKARKFVNLLYKPEHAKKLIRRNLVYAQVRVSSGDPPKLKSNYFDMFARNLFSVNFVYFPKYKLLGIVGDYEQDKLGDQMDCWIYFQNSCDQDYELSIWKDKNIPLFEQVVADVEAMSEEEIKGLFDYDECDIPYCRRAEIYRRIFEALALDDWMAGTEQETDDFICFTMSSLNSIEQRWKIEQYFKVIFKNEEEM